jgi:hypothetical protein
MLFLESPGQALLDSRGPASHRGVAQTPRLFDQERFDLVGAPDRPLGIGTNLHNRLKTLH